MTYSSASGHAPRHCRTDNVVDLPQEAALIRELRRLQKFLHQEQERVRFPHAIEIRPTNSRSDYRGGTGSRTPPKAVNGAVGRLLRKLGLNRRKPATEPSLRERPRTCASQSRRPDMKLPPHPRPAQKPERMGPPSSTTAKTRGGHGHLAADYHFSGKKPWRVSLLDRIGSPSPAEAQKRVTPTLRGRARISALRPGIRAPAVCREILGRSRAGDWSGGNRSQTHHAFKPCLGGRTQNRSSGADLRCWHPRRFGRL